MSVHDDNKAKQLELAKKQARLAHSAHEYFTQTEGGKELYRELAFQAGEDVPAFSGKDNFNPTAAAYRDGMRGTFLIIKKLIDHHERNQH